MGSGNSTLHATNYDPYGNPRAVGGLTQTAFGFTGQQTDSTGLQYLRARYYSPANGTFLTADPVLGVVGGPASTFNPYSYVRGNTVNLTDPSGMFTGLEILALVAFVAAATAIITGITSLIGEIAEQLGKSGGDWHCLDIGDAARKARDAALLGGGIGAGVGLLGGLAAPWLISIAGTVGAQNPDKVQKAVDVIGEVGESISHALTSGDASISHIIVDDNSSIVQEIANLGSKLEYLLGNVSSSPHNYERSITMERQFNAIGIFDNTIGRDILTQHLNSILNDATTIINSVDNRVIRESLLAGPDGFLKLHTIWDGNRLITVIPFGGSGWNSITGQ